MISIQHLSVQLQGRDILKDISFAIMREPIFYHRYNKMISSVVPEVSVWGRDIRTIPRELYET